MTAKKSVKGQKIKLIVRQANHSDIAGIVALSTKVYGPELSLTDKTIAGQISNFPEGQFVAEYNGRVVGHCATFIISGAIALKQHNWDQITGYGYASRHDLDGDYLYGMEVCVDPGYRRLRIGQRLYNARKKLCTDYHLKGIVFGGRMPGYGRRAKSFPDPTDYLDQVLEGQIKDTVINFHIRNGFEAIGVLKNYLPTDKSSRGHASHMIWHNPAIEEGDNRTPEQRGRTQNSVRIATVQYQVRKVNSFEDFAKQVEYFVDVAADYTADFVLFPELLTIPLVSMEPDRLSPQQSIELITNYTDQYVKFMQNLAVSYNINIIGGSHPTRIDEDTIENHAYIFLRDGQFHTQPKLHPTPNESYWWNIKGGDSLKAIQTDCGPIGVLVCYDTEFPEPVRHLTDQGAKILFVPFCTDERQGYLRVKYCCQARAVENQIYVATAGIVGNLPDVENMDVHYAESGIYTPCDFPFARDGIAAMTDVNTESIVFADLRLDQLTISRNSGTVRNLKDRRFDLYRVDWKKR
ncbi:bifunctional GNAT family N-acetyltransferase/carbon-nitrogen hydrolase family protein [Sneathiella limimaris]|uniref:bifunctional GNAT family N-acetyltransferase/carbon-nitrogen hydrolase family protein n=1 Tax=Sneathiella limimaris TaxID=1964213 RepID=UPI00146F5508|nr:bifunctional GNAT family N-acetyltransferase/carbon-nitrogen hydrolase family protein [Sneathiella limimaris]